MDNNANQPQTIIGNPDRPMSTWQIEQDNENIIKRLLLHNVFPNKQVLIRVALGILLQDMTRTAQAAKAEQDAKDALAQDAQPQEAPTQPEPLPVLK